MITLVKEDGTGLATANVYADAADLAAYAAERLIDIDDYEADQIAAALAEATIYQDMRWGSNLKGIPLNADQALEFARSSLTDRYGNLIEGVPGAVLTVNILYALKWIAGELYPANQTSAKELKKKKTVVGPITTELEYLGVASATDFLSFPMEDGLMKQFTTSGSGSGGRVIRG